MHKTDKRKYRARVNRWILLFFFYRRNLLEHMANSICHFVMWTWVPIYRGARELWASVSPSVAQGIINCNLITQITYHCIHVTISELRNVLVLNYFYTCRGIPRQVIKFKTMYKSLPWLQWRSYRGAWRCLAPDAPSSGGPRNVTNKI